VSDVLLELASRLLSASRYGDVAEVMHALERDRIAVGDSTLAGFLSAARVLSLACRDSQAEVEAHRLAINAGAQLEMRLRKQLEALLDMVASTAGGNRATYSQEHDRPVAPAPRDPRQPVGTTRNHDAVVLMIHCLGPFRVCKDNVVLGPWPNRRAKSLFKYLIIHRARPIPKDVLMDVFWPHADANAARNNLNVAVHGLRRFLRMADKDIDHILFLDDCYLLNPQLSLWVDLDEFNAKVALARNFHRDGDEKSLLRALEDADAVYRGALFEDDLYDEWTLEPRRNLQDMHVEVLEQLRDRYFAAGDFAGSARVARQILAVEPAHENTHRVLMVCYYRQGQHHLALRQYHDCEEALHSQLDAPPSAATTELYAHIRAHEPV
jgi:DNA-binding SARP family transcriptional activator